MPFYHSAPVVLTPGSIIESGNWGRIIRTVGDRHGRWQREQLFEAVRARQPNAALLPPRLDAAFACTSEDGLRHYHAVQLMGGSLPAVLYEVEKVDANALEHRTNFNLPVMNVPGLDDEQTAERYWQGDYAHIIADGPNTFHCEEMLTLSALRVVRQL